MLWTVIGPPDVMLAQAVLGRQAWSADAKRHKFFRPHPITGTTAHRLSSPCSRQVYRTGLSSIGLRRARVSGQLLELAPHSYQRR